MFLLEPFREYPKAAGELLSYYTGRSLKTRGHELLVHICIHTYIYVCVALRRNVFVVPLPTLL